jgi:hypothetical protein
MWKKFGGAKLVSRAHYNVIDGDLCCRKSGWLLKDGKRRCLIAYASKPPLFAAASRPDRLKGVFEEAGTGSSSRPPYTIHIHFYLRWLRWIVTEQEFEFSLVEEQEIVIEKPRKT